MSTELDIFELTDHARRAQRKLATSSSAQRNAVLRAISAALIADSEEILESNARDCERALDKGMAAGLVDRLRLDDCRVRSIAQSALKIRLEQSFVGDAPKMVCVFPRSAFRWALSA